MMLKAPNLDSRSGKEIFGCLAQELKQRLGLDAEGGDPMAGALMRIFARYSELIIQRLNRVPEKNHLVFLDALNVSRVPAVPAQVALTFNPVKKLPAAQTPIIVPARTQVAAPAGPGENDPIVFETTRELALTDLKLEKIIALDPQTDLFTNKSSLAACDDAGAPEFAFAARTPVAHEFYIRHDEIFSRPGISRLSLQFDMAGGTGAMREPAMIEWRIATPDKNLLLKPVTDTTLNLSKSGEVVFADLPEWPEDDLFGRHGRWLACRLQRRLPHLGAVTLPIPGFPPIQSVALSAHWQVNESVVKAAFYNNLALDVTRHFFPFGERPRFNDVFYLSSDAFAQPQTSVVLHVILTNPASAGKSSPLPRANQAGEPVVQWEYWDGKRWLKLPCRDRTEALTVNGEISFTLPASAQAIAVNGVEGLWIRARLVSGNYGEDERIEFSTAGNYQRILSTLSPPSIQSIAVTSSATAGPVRPDAIVTHNNFVIEDVKEAAPFRPFTAATDPHRALYLGFQAPDGAPIGLAQSAVDLYFHIGAAPDGRPYLREVHGPSLPKFTWQYWNGRDWLDANVEHDTTESLTVPGVLTVRAAEDIAPWRQTSLGFDLFWLRALWTEGEFEYSPALTRLLLNTVCAAHCMTLRNELLGSSSGKPNQSFRTARRPILQRMRLEVREPDVPETEDLQRLHETEGENAVTIVRDAQGMIEQIWVRWHEVEDWLSSAHGDRHFVVNRETGEIMFGDDKRGRIPPAGTNNVRLEQYQTGGGRAGNKPRDAIVQLRTTVPYVDSVNNCIAASGGQDIEDLDSLRERGARWLRHRSRAVAAQDYEDLARLASPVVAQAKCYSVRDLAIDPAGEELRPGMVSVVIVPRSEDPRPQPDVNLLRRVRDFLEPRRAPDGNLLVLGPEYVRFCVTAVVVPESTYEGASLVLRCQDTLRHYLHPVAGGEFSRGWEFGALPHESDLYAVLESVQGLKYVQSLDVRMEEGRQSLLQSGNFLISSGEHRVQVGS